MKQCCIKLFQHDGEDDEAVQEVTTEYADLVRRSVGAAGPPPYTRLSAVSSPAPASHESDYLRPVSRAPPLPQTPSAHALQGSAAGNDSIIIPSPAARDGNTSVEHESAADHDREHGENLQGQAAGREQGDRMQHRAAGFQHDTAHRPANDDVQSQVIPKQDTQHRSINRESDGVINGVNQASYSRSVQEKKHDDLLAANDSETEESEKLSSGRVLDGSTEHRRSEAQSSPSSEPADDKSDQMSKSCEPEDGQVTQTENIAHSQNNAHQLTTLSSSDTSTTNNTRRPAEDNTSWDTNTSSDIKQILTDSNQKAQTPEQKKDVTDPKTFLDEVATVDSAGQPLPMWKRMLLAKIKAKEYQEKLDREAEQEKWENLPAWKKALVDKYSQEKQEEEEFLDGLPPWKRALMEKQSK